MTSSANSSLASDLSRIVLLGIAFDVSRYITREILGALSSKIRDGGGEENLEGQLVTRCSGIGPRGRDGGDAEEQLIASNDDDLINITILASAAGEIIERLKSHINRLMKSLSNTISDRRLLWASPVRLPSGNDNGDDCEVKGRKDLITDTRENLPKKDSSDGLGKFTPIPPARLPPSISLCGNEIERRPRSDSLVTECSVSTQTMNAPVVENDERKYLEILVHNVSHTDLIMGLSVDEVKIYSSLPVPVELQNTERTKNASTKTNNVDRIDDRDEKYIMCRPRFSAFDMFSRRVLSELQGQIESGSSSEELYSSNSVSSRHPLRQKIISYPRYERSSKTARYTLVTPRPSDQYMLPVGFNLERIEGINNTAVDPSEMQNLRLRGRDIGKVDPQLFGETPRRFTLPQQSPENMHSIPLNEGMGMQTPSRSRQEALRINAVFFPLLATLLPRWLGKIADKFGGTQAETKIVSAPLYTPNVKKVIVLVSGVGTPRNWTHLRSGNSTQTCAELMELFIHILYPDITVVRIHSETNLFRYDENITFATQELMPLIDLYRDAHARSEPYPDESVAPILERNPFYPDWRQTVSVTYSFADGSAARSHAIQAALRPYRPTYFHFWQLKTFWHESKITDEDIEVHSFEEMETVPAMAIDQTPDTVIMVVNEMKAFRKYYIETLKAGGRNDVESFWLRKSKQPVLAVLLVQKHGGSYVLYRGTNMEVSMPTGSLCAERNVIGTALANDPGLKREDLLMVAVLSLQLPGNKELKCLPPPGPPRCRPVVSSAREGADFVKDVSDKLKQHKTHGAMPHVLSTSSFAGIAEERPSLSSDEWEMEVFQADHSGMSPLASPFLSAKQFVESSDLAEAALIPDLSLSRLSETCPSGIPCGDSTPKRRISLYQKKSLSNMGEDAKRQKVLVQPLQDMNPLKPCGACNEWLKKIAQSNPHFKVLTFTDNQCNGVYISPCEE